MLGALGKIWTQINSSSTSSKKTTVNITELLYTEKTHTYITKQMQYQEQLLITLCDRNPVGEHLRDQSVQELSGNSLLCVSVKTEPPRWLHSWQWLSYMICLYLQETSLFLERVKPQESKSVPSPWLAHSFKQQKAVTLAVCSVPLVQKWGGHFGHLRQNQHYVMWIPASSVKAFLWVLFGFSLGQEYRQIEDHKTQPSTWRNFYWRGLSGARFGSGKGERGNKVQWGRERELLQVWLIISVCVCVGKPFSHLAGFYPEQPTRIHMNACFCKHVSRQTHKHMLSSGCTVMPHWSL